MGKYTFSIVKCLKDLSLGLKIYNYDPYIWSIVLLDFPTVRSSAGKSRLIRS